MSKNDFDCCMRWRIVFRDLENYAQSFLAPLTPLIRKFFFHPFSRLSPFFSTRNFKGKLLRSTRKWNYDYQNIPYKVGLSVRKVGLSVRKYLIFNCAYAWSDLLLPHLLLHWLFSFQARWYVPARQLSIIIKQIRVFVFRFSRPNRSTDHYIWGTIWIPKLCRVLLAIARCNMANCTGTRDQKVYARCILGALGSTYRGKWGISWSIAEPSCRIFC